MQSFSLTKQGFLLWNSGITLIFCLCLAIYAPEHTIPVSALLTDDEEVSYGNERDVDLNITRAIEQLI